MRKHSVVCANKLHKTGKQFYAQNIFSKGIPRLYTLCQVASSRKPPKFANVRKLRVAISGIKEKGLIQNRKFIPIQQKSPKRKFWELA